MQRIQEAGGHFIIEARGPGMDQFAGLEGEDDEIEMIDEGDSPDESS